jgi:hypothetical protein
MLPEPIQDQTELELAVCYAPVLYFDSNEPFLPLRVGYTIFDQSAPSPSFPRQLELELPGYPLVKQVIEYAIWWDWDIQHLYELEHFWAYIGEKGELVYAEASWHGKYRPAVVAPGEAPLTLPGTNHTRIYAQPGKHAFLPDPQPFKALEHRPKLTQPCGPEAGTAGLLVTPLFQNQNRLTRLKTPQADALAKAYLKTQAFTPAFSWDKAFELTSQQLVPWPILFEWIPARINWILEWLDAANYPGI